MPDRPANTPPSLTVQLTIVFGTLVVLASIATTWILSDMLRGRIRADAGRSLIFAAAAASRTLANGLHANAAVVGMIASREALWGDGLASPEARRALELIEATQPTNLWVGVANPQGRVAASTRDILHNESVAERPWFQNGQRSLYVGDVHPAKLLATLLPPDKNNEPLRFLDYSAPVMHEGRIIGVIGVHTSWDWAGEVIDTVLPAEARAAGIEVFIFDRQGDVIYAPGGQSRRLADAGVRLPASGQAPGAAAVVRWHDGADYLTATSPLAAHDRVSDLGWTIVAREPAANAFAAVADTTRSALLIGLLTALVGSLLAGVAARRFGADLMRMARAARDVESGAPGARIPMATSSAEMQTLAVALSSMTRRLVDAREDLEQQVRQRTLELEAANAELGHQAHTDALTGLPNRRMFDPLLARALADARRQKRSLSVLMIDADHFKQINDVHGHAVGDEVLRRLTALLSTNLRTGDVVARLGGEEFAAILPDTDTATALQVAHELVTVIARDTRGLHGGVTVSIGVASCSDGLIPTDELLRRADQALYQAKAEGRDTARAYHPIE
ncbi:sensor domain-containing diguanylate cyclase [Variovorax ginsengisoli]|uniref:diguanylate cyclase n=1 Tax=Variovorax ginsengisoli TaxID=363844 RepID=A0ABT9S6N8_9BURK|nr:diguanylate cyclase [Variovorax ginsengisoli]MDP9899885.1 diguanylate cyclase (GGDEF)-like protein [Variovorax ginsengisoli]